MFDSEQVAELDAAATMSLVSGAHRLVPEQECLLVQLAAHWCDLHFPDSQPATERNLPGAERGQSVGGEGTTEVLEFAAVELGGQLETTAGSAKALMADALHPRHRLPELWQLSVQVGCGCGAPGEWRTPPGIWVAMQRCMLIRRWHTQSSLALTPVRDPHCRQR